ncbi:MAG TPA: glycoside hydrolase family 16 protein [Thermogutta sp.]|nr:glycoside hydrolase family 16 protein [Thermogutta sp.]HPU06895.1 glycoside hydrolase family 16 protein [Thermogutta sp.]
MHAKSRFGIGVTWLGKVAILSAAFSFLLGLTPAVAEESSALPPVESLLPPDPLPALPDGKKWQLVWHDEFEGLQIDTTKWEIYGDWKRRDGYWVKEDSFLDGKGHLVIRTKKSGDRYTSGAIATKGKFEPRFGYLVCRCTHPKQPGMWAAFWMFGPGVTRVGDEGRDGTEIDIMEMPYRDGRLTSNLHWDGYGKDHKHAGTTFRMPEILEGFHTYGLWWKPDEYVFDVDGKETWRTSAGGVCQVPLYIKLTVEIGSWAGDIKTAQLPEDWLIDYVRVYQMFDKEP